MNRIAKFEKVSFEQFKKDWLNVFPETVDWKLESIYENIKLPTRSTTGSAGYDFYLPNEIEHNGKRGYLTVDTYSLSWTAYHAQQLIIAKTFSMPIGINTNIFDVFILALEFVINNNLNNEE